MKLNIRKLKDSDWNTLVELWNDWPEWVNHPTKDMLPENGTGGFIVEKNKTPIVAGFMYTTNSKVAWLEWIVSNVNYKDKDKNDAIKLLIAGIEHVAKESGFKIILSIGRNKNLINTHKEIGYQVDDKPSYEIIKII
tara:strand:- start:1604 stop:2014 length:411 start_codon:yes stop_codon:yes gene_type:complete